MQFIQQHTRIFDGYSYKIRRIGACLNLHLWLVACSAIQDSDCTSDGCFNQCNRVWEEHQGSPTTHLTISLVCCQPCLHLLSDGVFGSANEGFGWFELSGICSVLVWARGIGFPGVEIRWGLHDRYLQGVMYCAARVYSSKWCDLKVMWWVPIIKSFEFRGSELQIPSRFETSLTTVSALIPNCPFCHCAPNTDVVLILDSAQHWNLVWGRCSSDN